MFPTGTHLLLASVSSLLAMYSSCAAVADDVWIKLGKVTSSRVTAPRHTAARAHTHPRLRLTTRAHHHTSHARVANRAFCARPDARGAKELADAGTQHRAPACGFVRSRRIRARHERERRAGLGFAARSVRRGCAARGWDVGADEPDD